jgi:hypothetical protein
MKRGSRVFLLLVLLAVLAASTAYLYLVPSGLPNWGCVVGYMLLSVDRGAYVSPDGSRTIRIVDLDGGALHSGQFRTFVVARSWLRDRVIADNWLSEPGGPVPVRWLDGRHVVVKFSEGESQIEVP